MYRIVNWGLGTAAVLLLASAYKRRQKPARASGGPVADEDLAPSETTAAESAISGMLPAGQPASPAPRPNPSPAETGVLLGGAPVVEMSIVDSERDFVNEAAASGLAEIEASRLVANRTTDQPLKSYAQQLEREHTSSNAELKRIAGRKGIALPETAGRESKVQLDRLKALSGTQGDRIFVQDFGIEAHHKAIRLFEDEAREGHDPELRAFAQQALPRLREHLVTAQQLRSKSP